MTGAERAIIDAALEWARCESKLRSVNSGQYQPSGHFEAQCIVLECDLTEERLLSAVKDLPTAKNEGAYHYHYRIDAVPGA